MKAMFSNLQPVSSPVHLSKAGFMQINFLP